MTPVALIMRMRELGADNAHIRIAQLALGATPRTCKGCSTEFLIGPGTGNAANLQWCTPVCYQRHYKRARRDEPLPPRDYRTEWEKATGVPLNGPTLENALWRNGIRSMDDLARQSAAEILRIQGVGRTSLRHIQDALVRHKMRSRSDANDVLERNT